MSWSHEQVDILIEMYRIRPCLYDVKSPAYKNRLLRNKAYEEIQQELRAIRPATNVVEIKSKINGLRTTFLTEYRKGKHYGTGTGADEVSKYEIDSVRDYKIFNCSYCK